MDSMRSCFILLSALGFLSAGLGLVACGGRNISDNTVKQLIANLPGDAINKNDVCIESVRQNGNNAIVQVNVRTAFRLEKVENEWVIREIRLGDDQWQSLAELRQALNRLKTEETRRLLDQIGTGIDKFLAKNGALPIFTDYVSLADVLTPEYMPLIRLDAWRRPFAAQLTAADTIRLTSSGPDGEFGTADDVLLIKRSSR